MSSLIRTYLASLFDGTHDRALAAAAAPKPKLVEAATKPAMPTIIDSKKGATLHLSKSQPTSDIAAAVKPSHKLAAAVQHPVIMAHHGAVPTPKVNIVADATPTDKLAAAVQDRISIKGATGHLSAPWAADAKHAGKLAAAVQDRIRIKGATGHLFGRARVLPRQEINAGAKGPGFR